MCRCSAADSASGVLLSSTPALMFAAVRMWLTSASLSLNVPVNTPPTNAALMCSAFTFCCCRVACLATAFAALMMSPSVVIRRR